MAGEDAANNVGHPGGIWAHVRYLAASLRAGDFGEALGHFTHLLQLIREDIENVQPLEGFATPVASDSASIADQLDGLADTRETQGRGAFAWLELLPLLLQVLASIFAKR